MPYSCVSTYLYRLLVLRKAYNSVDYIGYWAAQKTVIVAHEGTDPTHMCVNVFRNY